MNRSRFPTVLLTGALLSTLGCTSEQVDASEDRKVARAVLKSSAGKEIGYAEFTNREDGLNVHLEVSNLKPGSLALHIHEKGACEPPKFESAGDHFNPTNAKHGFDAPGGPHLGDLRNFSVTQDGTASVERFAKGVSLGEEHSVVGKAIVIHSGPDDYRTQPSGGAGDRIACGVIERN